MSSYSVTKRKPMANSELSDEPRTSDYLAGQSELVRHYYASVPYEDLASRDLIELNAAALSHWNIAAKRVDNECMIRIYNPNSAEHGWESNHSIVEINTTDKPFLVRSVALAITNHGYSINQFIHPVLSVHRKSNGELDGMAGSDAKDAVAESFMQLHIDRIFDESAFDQLKDEILQAINYVNLVCDDWEPMKAACTTANEKLRTSVKNDFDTAESCDFIEWLQRFHFTFTGYCELEENSSNLSLVDGKSHGLFRSDKADGMLYQCIPQQELEAIANELLYITKSTKNAPVMWPKPMDVITFRRIDEQGNVNGCCVVSGFFTSRADSTDLDAIPLLRHKSLNIVAKSGINPGAHDGKILLNTLESFPRDMLLQSEDTTIAAISRGIMNLLHHPRVRLFGIQGRFNRFATCFVYVPSEIYTRELRHKIQDILFHSLNADNVEFDITLSSDGPLARLHFFLRTPANNATQNSDADFATIEQEIIEAAQDWDDKLRDALLNDLSDNQQDQAASELTVELSRGIPVSYKEQYDTATATRDIELLRQVQQKGRINVLFYRDNTHSATEIGFNIYHGSEEVPLSKTIHILENMGVPVNGEKPYEIKSTDQTLNIRVFRLHHPGAENLPIAELADDFQQTFLKVWHGEVDDDGLNQLVLTAGLTWRQTTILRCYCKYLLQIKVPYSQDYMTGCLINNAPLVKLAVQHFEQRFDPAQPNADLEKITREFATKLDEVVSLDEDRILRTFNNAIAATVRSNFYKTDDNGNTKDYLSIKLIPSQIDGMPLPCPEFEIFVCSPRVEAVHLRGGKVARGGLRWSDRREDFRTEVLGLMKAQMVKNSVIVPVGSKGGFVVKQPPVGASRDVLMKEVVSCYQTFLRGMLDITDNYINGEIVAPVDVVRHDADDPYLVVAADKGTATFSDIANGISDEFGFWLGDAFASGGSVGYDHKGMGITAKGAWESVKRHFREYNFDTQKQEFTVVGIGDMSGDVFGNGMLLSKQIKLLAAFNHMHIFLDPDPDAAKCFAERDRLFKLPRSSWEDYNTDLISKGGGIFSRTLKSIPISAEVKVAFGIKKDDMAPNELISTLLASKVDLLWNGGIGTYIKASTETHVDAQDKANDPLRVDARDLQCKVVGEGGNLGCTQLGRIEFAARGGKIYTDAIDNSAGVDCSDHEVNIKILVDSLVTDGSLPAAKRSKLLADMTDDVSDLVLRDNYQQTQCISLALAQAPSLLEEHARFVNHMESNDKLNRAIEFLPDNEAIADRAAKKQGLTAPELAVIVAYSKMDIYEQLLDSELVEDPFFETELLSYFPDLLSRKFETQTLQHQLRREIVATQVTNSLVNRLGPTYLFRLQDELGAHTPEIAAAYVAVRSLFGMRDLWSSIEQLDNTISNETQTEMLLMVRGWVERGVHWLVKNRRTADGIQPLVDNFASGMNELRSAIPEVLAKPNKASYRARCRHFSKAGVPDDIAAAVASVVPLSSGFDILDISHGPDSDLSIAAGVYFELGEYLDIQWLREQIGCIDVSNHWHALAKSALRSDLHYQQRHLCAEVINTIEKQKTAAAMVRKWSAQSAEQLENYTRRLTEIKSAGNADYAMLSLAVNEVHKLLQSDRPLAGSG